MPAKTNRQKMVKVTIRFTEEQYNWLKRMATERGTSMSQVVRDAMDLYLKRMGLKPDM